MSLKAKLEAVIYAAEEPVTLTQLATLFADEALEWKAAREAEPDAQASVTVGGDTMPLLNAELSYFEPDSPAAVAESLGELSIESASAAKVAGEEAQPATEEPARETGTATAEDQPAETATEGISAPESGATAAEGLTAEPVSPEVPEASVEPTSEPSAAAAEGLAVETAPETAYETEVQPADMPAAEATAPETQPEAAPEAAPEPPVDAEAEAKRQARLRDREVKNTLRQLLDELIESYANDDRGVEIREIAGGYRMATKPECHDAVRSFVKSLKPALKLSLPALETLAVIAYKQPITAPEVNEIRGVDSSGVFGSLLSRKLIATAGRKQVIGRPILYKTTKEFLLRFGLKDVTELPSMEEFEKMAASELEEAGEPTAAEQTATAAGSTPEFDENSPEDPVETAAKPAPADESATEPASTEPAVTADDNQPETALAEPEAADEAPEETEAPAIASDPQTAPDETAADGETANEAESTRA